jgi:long-chain acyl-CoA synthetase
MHLARGPASRCAFPSLHQLRRNSATRDKEKMDLHNLVSNLPTRDGALYTVERGATVKRSYNKLYLDCIQAQYSLRSWGVCAGTRVGIYAPNSYYWLVYDLALIEIGAVSVAFSEDFKDEIGEDLLERYSVSLLLTSKDWAGRFPSLSGHVAFIDDPYQDDARIALRSPKISACHDQDQLGLVFSSGSSGGLKGLVISRQGVSSTLPPVLEAAGISNGDRLLLFLPMSNFQQRYLCYGALWFDFDIILTEYTQLFKTMERLHPTVLLAPPVFYQMIYAEFLKKEAWKRSLQLAIAALFSLVPISSLRRMLARRVFSDFYRQFGNRMRLLITGMAPIRPNIPYFFHRMHLPLCEAYGMVEAGVMTYRAGNSTDYATVGKPLRDVSLSFASDGEILVTRKHTVASRYFQCADGENEATFIAPGKIATGDIGTLDRKGQLILFGRKKELIVTPSGNKIHPEAIEKELNTCPEIASSVVFLGRSPDLRCVVSLNIPCDEETRLRVKQFVTGHRATRKATQFVRVIFTDGPFTRENGMLRPNMKIDRKRIIDRYGAI